MSADVKYPEIYEKARIFCEQRWGWFAHHTPMMQEITVRAIYNKMVKEMEARTQGDEP